MIKTLLDTTYLLPIIGIEVESIEQVITKLNNLYTAGKVEIYYTPYNILEILAKLSKTKYDTERVRLGLLSIEKNFKLLIPSIEDYILTLKLRQKDLKT